MGRRSSKPRKHPLSLNRESFSSKRIGAGDFTSPATRSVPNALPLVLRSLHGDEHRVSPVVAMHSRLMEPLPFVPSSLWLGKVAPLPPSRGRGDARATGNTISRLLQGLQASRSIHRYSTPCEARRTRSRVLHALGIAGRKGVGAGKPRRMSKFSHVRCA